MKNRFLQVFGIFKVRETGNREYWFSQIVVLASTVIGVYLAAQAGYKAAIEFEITRGERDGYYLRRTLLTEIKSNIKAVDEWSAGFEHRLRENIDPAYFEPTENWVHFFNDKMGWAYLGELTDSDLERKLLDARRAGLTRRYYTNEEKAERLNSKFVPDEFKLRTFIWDNMKSQITTLQLPPDLIAEIQNYYTNMAAYNDDIRSNTEKAGPAAVAIHADTDRLSNVAIAILERDIAKLRSRLESKDIELE